MLGEGKEQRGCAWSGRRRVELGGHRLREGDSGERQEIRKSSFYKNQK